MSKASLKPGWRTVKLGDVVNYVRDRVRREETGLEYYLGGEHFDKASIHVNGRGTIANSPIGPAFHMRFKPGQTLLVSRNPHLRKASIAEFEGICADTTYVCEAVAPVLLPELLPFLMQTDAFWEHAERNKRGSTNPYLNWSDFASFEFALPPIEEQKRIAELLWAADEAIQGHETVLEKANQLLDVIRETVICDERFERCKLGDILTSIVAGKSVSGASTPAKPDECGVLKVSAVGPNGFDPIENKRLMDQSEFLPQYSVRRNALLITRCNTTDLVGRVCLTEHDDGNLMLCDKTLELVPDESKLRKLLLFEVLRSRGLRTQIRSRATGTGGAMKNISQDDIRSLVVPIPDEQKVIAGRVLAVTDRISSINQHLSLMRGLAKQLSNELISGRGADHV